MNEVTTQQSGAVAEYGGNAFTSYGEKAASVGLPILKFTKGDWLYGQEGDEIDIGTRFLANMDGLKQGWIRWENLRPAEEHLFLVVSGEQPPKRGDLGCTDQEYWDTDDNGNPRDPWQFTNVLPLRFLEGDREECTFNTTSRGGIGAIGVLCKAYGKEFQQRPGQTPVIEVGVDSYQHSNKSYGRIKVPTLTLVGWVDEDGNPVGDEPKKVAASGKAKKKAQAGDDDPVF